MTFWLKDLNPPQPNDNQTNYHCSTLTRKVLPECAAALTRRIINLYDVQELTRDYTAPRWCCPVPLLRRLYYVRLDVRLALET
jgi:hypothetical protein